MSFSKPVIVTPTDALDTSLLDRLIVANESIIIFRGFICDLARSEAVKDLLNCRQNQSIHSYSNASLTTLGPYIAKHTSAPKLYFSAALETEVHLPQSIVQMRERVYQLLKSHLGFGSLEIAADPVYGTYSGSIVRFHGDGVFNPLHNDNIARDARLTDLYVRKIKHQLSCVICLQECTSGGELRLYDKKWSLEDEKFKVNGSLGYQPIVVQPHNYCTFSPKSGDVYIFDPGFYHEIDEVHGDERITMGFFWGTAGVDFDNVVAWS